MKKKIQIKQNPKKKKERKNAIEHGHSFEMKDKDERRQSR